MSESLSSWLVRLEARHPKSIDLGLDRCARVYRNMDSPRPAPVVITVGGTNGKGSVVAFLSAVLTALGFRCASYTSPHLLEFNERIRIDGTPVSDQQLLNAFESTDASMKGTSLTYFEFTTLSALKIMSESDLDIAILEVGLGGRLDTVNLVNPDCAVITNIALDHQQYLGEDRESIGFEKAGIMRNGIPVICGDRNPPDSVLEHAESIQAHLRLLGREFDYLSRDRMMNLKLGQKRMTLPVPAMNGTHQRDNLATAIAAIHFLDSKLLKRKWAWKKVIPELHVPGRLYRLPSDPRFVVDVGHNPHAAIAVSRFLAAGTHQQVYCVLGMFRDKDTAGVAKLLDAEVDQWLCAGLPGPRGQTGKKLASKISNTAEKTEVSVFKNVAQAVVRAKELAGEKDLVLVFGSFETAAEAMRQFE
jgi:dihydrofolate synthase/folylpolyglutamate synthase